MAVNKIIYGGNTLVDLTSDTVTANDLAEGITATAADGNKVVGVMTKGEIASYDEIDNALALAGTGTIPSGGVVSIAQGGTGATTAAQARANLGAVRQVIYQLSLRVAVTMTCKTSLQYRQRLTQS